MRIQYFILEDHVQFNRGGSKLSLERCNKTDCPCQVVVHKSHKIKMDWRRKDLTDTTMIFGLLLDDLNTTRELFVFCFLKTQLLDPADIAKPFPPMALDLKIQSTVHVVHQYIHITPLKTSGLNQCTYITIPMSKISAR